MKKVFIIVLFLSLAGLIFLGGRYIYFKYMYVPFEVEFKDTLVTYDKENNVIKLNINVVSNAEELYYAVSYDKGKDLDYSKVDGAINTSVNPTNCYFYFKNENDDKLSYKLSDVVDIKGLSVNYKQSTFYMYEGEKNSIDFDVVTLYDTDSSKYTLKSQDESIAVVQDNEIIAVSPGKTYVYVEGLDNLEKVEVIVSNLFTSYQINNSKPFIGCKEYSNEEAEILDSALKARIAMKGYATRAGVVEAARFFLLQFPYRVNYFPENGRLSSSGRRYADGEGRYYHEGLYLSESDYDSIVAKVTGPAMWGCPLYAASGEEDQPAGNYYANGLDCSGFISWIFINGGYDVGDIGAGFSSAYDFSDLGERKPITYQLLSSGKIKAGDLIAQDGHMAMIIGIDDNNVYVGDILIYNVGTRVRKFTYSELASYKYLDYIIPMDDFYGKDGNYSNMW